MAEWKKCAWCGKNFNKDNAVYYSYCSKRCHNEAHNADPEGTSKEVESEAMTQLIKYGCIAVVVSGAGLYWLWNSFIGPFLTEHEDTIWWIFIIGAIVFFITAIAYIVLFIKRKQRSIGTFGCSIVYVLAVVAFTWYMFSGGSNGTEEEKAGNDSAVVSINDSIAVVDVVWLSTANTATGQRLAYIEVEGEPAILEIWLENNNATAQQLRNLKNEQMVRITIKNAGDDKFGIIALEALR